MTRLVLAAAFCLSGGAAAMAADTTACRPGAKPVARVELFFGAGAGGRSAWMHFLSRVVTPRFPDGLTQFEAAGQWKDGHRLTREATRVLVIFYRPNATIDARIEEIRALYDHQFRQKSVLRADSMSCVSF